jgi:KTSC domain-containing protein
MRTSNNPSSLSKRRFTDMRSLYGTSLVCTMVGVVVLLSGWPAFAECVTTIKYRDTPVCLDTFACIETPQSRFVREICYDAAKSYMLIKLNDTWYHYCAVDRASVYYLIHAGSIWTYYNWNFRSNGPSHGPFDCTD